ncbi:MAG: protein-export chaperone SecB [Desulfohalobiaceae bacterium]|nr:protein-export chaperone SecB [Desulfohalobiaceae bacterium]
MDKKQFNKPPINLDFHFFSNVNIVANQNLVPAELNSGEHFENYDIETEVNVLRNENNPFNFQITLEIHYDNKEFEKAYEFGLKIVGFFTVDENQDQEQLEKCVNVLGPSILYGAAREFLLTITNRGPYPPVYLPTVSFVPIEDNTAEEV